MKHLFPVFFFLLISMAARAQADLPAGAAEGQLTVEPQLTPAQAAKRARKARRQRGPEVYKGSLAQKQRVITDAPDAEEDQEPEAVATEEAKSPRKTEEHAAPAQH
jgi:hypothetical protein